MAMNGKWRFIDSSGIIYGETSRIPEGLIPVTAESASARIAVAKVIGSLPASIKRQVLTISASSEDSVELTLTGSRQVFWGSPTQSNRKVKVLSVLLNKRASFYDVSAPNFPTTRK
jgi:cell division protein FtsQ